MSEADEQALKKLVSLTKHLKEEKIKVKQLKPPSRNNKWKQEEPKFGEKRSKPDNIVQAGGMAVDPSRQSEYEAWHQAKHEEKSSSFNRLRRRPLPDKK